MANAERTWKGIKGENEYRRKTFRRKMEVFGLFRFLLLDWLIASFILIFPLFILTILWVVDRLREKKRAAAEAKARIEARVNQKERPDCHQGAQKVSPRYRRNQHHYIGKHEHRHNT